jgi:hypothetical protein
MDMTPESTAKKHQFDRPRDPADVARRSDERREKQTSNEPDL